MRAARRLFVLACVVLLAGPAPAAPVITLPTITIAPSEATGHLGEIVTVEGDVGDARVDAEGLVLELEPDQPKGFRVVLVLALISNLPRHPELLYKNRRIRVTAPVKGFQGRAEMIVQGADQIEVVDVAGAPVASAPPTTVPAPRGIEERARAVPAAPPPTTPVAPPAPPAPAAAPAPPAPEVPAPVAAAPVAPAPAPPATIPTAHAPAAPAAPAPTASAPVAPPPATTPPTSPPEEERPLLSERIAAARCDSARARWREAADAVRARTDALRHCLDETSYQCRERAAAVAPALTDLEWAEQQVADRCD